MLTETAIKHSKPKGRPYKIPDERGLFLLVQATGARWWRLGYRVWACGHMGVSSEADTLTL